MSSLIIQSETLDDIATAIRSKTGKSASMTPLEMPAEIRSIEGGGGSGRQVAMGTFSHKTSATTVDIGFKPAYLCV